MNIKEYNFVVTEEYVGQRLDAFLAAKTFLSRSHIKNFYFLLHINKKMVKLSTKVRLDDNVFLSIKESIEEVLPEDIPLRIVYEDENYLVINKAQGMVVHPAKGHYSGTLVNALLYRYENLPGEKNRAGIVHRLDKDTSGLLIVAKRQESFDYLSSLFRKRKIRKIYKAILKGHMRPFVVHIDEAIGRDFRNRKKMMVVANGGKDAQSVFRLMRESNKFSLVAIRIFSGRTHQIRVHASHIGYPILGDSLYSRRNNLCSQAKLALVATRLSFYDKFSNKTLDFKVKLPSSFKSFLESKM